MGNYFSYMRISTKEVTDKQTFKRQEKAIHKYAEENKIEFLREFKDDISGNTFDRKEWNILEKALRKDDTVVFKDISRFTRQTEEGLIKYMYLMDNGINLVFLDNPTISTEYIKQLGAVAEKQDLIIKKSINNIIELLLIVELDRVQKEREITIKRIKDGIKASNKIQGRKQGQIDKMSEELKKDIEILLKDRSVKYISVINKHNISRNTLKKYVERVSKEKKIYFKENG